MRLDRLTMAELMACGQAVAAAFTTATAEQEDGDPEGYSDFRLLAVPGLMQIIIALHAELDRRAKDGGTDAAAARLVLTPTATVLRQ